MCVPIGVEFACGDGWRGWIPCNQPACNITTYRRDGLPPTADLGDIAAGGNPNWGEVRRYHTWTREELAFLKFRSCCCPQCCQRLMDGEKQNGNAAYTKAVKDHLDHCVPVFRAGLAMLNCMRNVPTVFKPPVVDEALLTTLTPKSFAQNLAALCRDQAAGNNTGIDYDQPFVQRNAFTQYVHLRNDVFQHPQRVLNYRWKPQQSLTDLWRNQQLQFGPNVVNDGQVGFNMPSFHSGTQLLREAYIQSALVPAAPALGPFAPVYHNQANLGAFAPPPFLQPQAAAPAFPPPALPPPALPPPVLPPPAFSLPAFAPPPVPPPKKKHRANEPTDQTDEDDDTEMQGPRRRLGRDITSEGLLDASVSLYAASGANDPDSQAAGRGSGKRKQGVRRNYPPPAAKSFLSRDEWPVSFTQDKARKAYEKILATVQQLPEVPISTSSSSIQEQQESQRVASGNLKVLKSAGFDMTQIQQRETDTQSTDAAETVKVWRAAMEAMKERRGEAQTYMRQSQLPTQTDPFGPSQGTQPVPAYPPVPASAFGGHPGQTSGGDGGIFSEQDLYQDDNYTLPAEYDPGSGFPDPDPYGGGGNLLRIQPSTGDLRRTHKSRDRITDRQSRDKVPRDQSSDGNSRSSGNNSKGSDRGEKGDKRGGKSMTRTEPKDNRPFRDRMNDSGFPDFEKLTMKEQRKEGSSHGHPE